MRTVPAAITTARQSATSHLCKIWRVERVDGVVLRFTEHDRDLTVGGELFKSTASFDPTTIKSNAELSVGDLEVHGAFDDDYIDAIDLMAGRYNGATFYVAEVLWDNVAAGMDVLKFGWLGNITQRGGVFVAELLDASRILNLPILRTYTPGCNAALGDTRCGVNLTSFTHSGTVTSVTSNRVFDASGIDLPDESTVLGWSSFGWAAVIAELTLAVVVERYYEFGMVTMTSGLNDGLSMEVKSSDGTTVELMLAFPFEVAASDTFTIIAGCNKSLSQCASKFGNTISFRGFPHAPISDDVLKGLVATEGADSTGGVAPLTSEDFASP